MAASCVQNLPNLLGPLPVNSNSVYRTVQRKVEFLLRTYRSAERRGKYILLVGRKYLSCCLKTHPVVRRFGEMRSAQLGLKMMQTQFNAWGDIAEGRELADVTCRDLGLNVGSA